MFSEALTCQGIEISATEGSPLLPHRQLPSAAGACLTRGRAPTQGPALGQYLGDKRPASLPPLGSTLKGHPSSRAHPGIWGKLHGLPAFPSAQARLPTPSHACLPRAHPVTICVQRIYSKTGTQGMLQRARHNHCYHRLIYSLIHPTTTHLPSGRIGC